MLGDAPTTVTAAVALGAAGSLHCFVMCGPLACSARDATNPRRAAAAYHLARIGAYAAVGALLGGLGSALHLPLQSALPWVMVTVLLLAVVDPGGRRLKRLPPLPGIAHVLRLVAAARARLSPTARAALVGAVTPLLPCGLVYGIGAAAVATSSAAGGSAIMGGFALGAVPALAVAQLSTARGLRRLPPLPAAIAERALPLVAAALLAYRALATAAHHGCHGG